MYIITMDHRSRDYTDQALYGAGLNSQNPKIKAVEEFDAKRQPHDKHQPKGHNVTPKKSAFCGGHA